jgi:thiamine-phosphate diphosphorylase
MFKLLCVTNRKLCRESLSQRIGALCAGGIDAVILREKDLTGEEYEALAWQALEAGGEKVILHHFPAACAHLSVPRLHLSLGQLEAQPALREQVDLLGVSVHARSEAVRAQALGADYVTAGHVFDTACKRGLPGRGLAFLEEVCAAVSIPVYAIGGVEADNLPQIRAAGAAGACLMSGLMTCADPVQEVAALRVALREV